MTFQEKLRRKGVSEKKIKEIEDTQKDRVKLRLKLNPTNKKR